MKVLLICWCFSVKAEIFSQPGIWISGFWGNKGVLSRERGRCLTQSKMNQVELSQTNTGGDKIYGSWQGSKWKAHPKAVAGGEKEPWLNPEVLRSNSWVIQMPHPKREDVCSSRGGCRDWQSCSVSSRGSALLWGIHSFSFLYNPWQQRETLRVFIAALMDGGVRSLCTPELIFCIPSCSKCLFRVWLMWLCFIFAQ